MTRPKGDMRQHLTNIAMCAPMFVIAGVLVIGGSGTSTAMLPVLGCMLMMALMMWGMGAKHGHARHGADRRAADR